MILASDYPTRRAYGVTTLHTAAALTSAGHSVDVFSTSSALAEATTFAYRRLQPWLRQQFGRRSPLGPIAHHLSRATYLREISNSGKLADYDLLWVRDAYLASGLRRKFPRTRICVEVHQRPTPRQLRDLRSADSSATLWGPISQTTEDALLADLSPLRGQIARLPMAAADAFFEHANEESQTPASLSTDYPFRIGYFGSYTSGGHDQGVLEFVRSTLLTEFVKPVEILVVGVGDAGCDALANGTHDFQNANRLSVVPYTAHEHVPTLMRSCTVLVLPYPGGSSFFDSRFPLKLVEYAASQRAIVLTRTASHTSVFPSEAGFYYEPGKPDQFVSALQLAISNENERRTRSSHAFHWASQYTYKRRVQPVLDWYNRHNPPTLPGEAPTQ